MFILNKIVFAVSNPLLVAILALAASLAARRFRRLSAALVAFSVVWLWAWSTKAMYIAVGGWLERPYAKYATRADFAASGEETWGPSAAECPDADAIVVLGGGMGCHTNGCPYADMAAPADRVWHAVRLYRVGKAPLVVCSGFSDEWSTKPLLEDFGVPDSAMIFETASRNTEENARFVNAMLREKGVSKILLVTSAWHMRRSVLMFEKYAPDLEVMPCATDFEATMAKMHPDGIRFNAFFPDPDSFGRNCTVFKELLGLAGYTLFR
ncbi:MAG: YdcF family protein [Kiritimatiellae bacterium]|nr:YdcF family protein [Kiritimatiellia bacterium]